MSANLAAELAKIVRDPRGAGIILGGGFGMDLKRSELARAGTKTLLPLPQVRATQDLDLFLPIEMFVPGTRADAFGGLLSELGYEVDIARYQHGTATLDGGRLKVDLHARPPQKGEGVTWDRMRVGRDSGRKVHGRTTPEAFAVEDSPISVPVGSEAVVLVPHPYAWLNMKVEAAYDWLREEREEIPIRYVRDVEGGDTDARARAKHVYDVYALMAMLTEGERDEAREKAAHYRDYEMATKIRRKAEELYREPDAAGTRAAIGYAHDSFDRTFSIDHALFWEELTVVLGID